MNYYRLFVHERGYSKAVKIEAVKIGWSWPVFFFNSVWAAYKKMWGLAIALLLFTFLFSFVSGFGKALMDTNLFEGAIVLQWSGDIALGLYVAYVGSKANDWYAKNLLKHGFRQAVIIVAPNPDRAKIIFDKEYVYDDQADVWLRFDGILA